MPANLRLRTEWLNVNNDHIPTKHRHIAQHILFIQFKIMHCSRQPLSVAALTALLTARQLFVVDERLPAWQWKIERAREKSMREICAIRSGERGCGHKVLHIAIRIAEQRRLRLKLLTRIHWGKNKRGGGEDDNSKGDLGRVWQMLQTSRYSNVDRKWDLFVDSER